MASFPKKAKLSTAAAASSDFLSNINDERLKVCFYFGFASILTKYFL
jgi:hypothetical protein